MAFTPKDIEYLELMIGVLEEAYDAGGFDLKYDRSRFTIAMCMLDRMRGRERVDLDSERYWSEELNLFEQFKAARKAQYAARMEKNES